MHQRPTMPGVRSMMATASLSALLWRAGASSRSTFAPSSPSRLSASLISGRNHPSASTLRRHPASPSTLAFQSRSSFGRRPIATTFSNDGASSSSTHLRASSSQVEGARAADPASAKPIPTILLAGFLGSGKTTTLKHLLENNSDIRIGTIVNDVASVNIDAKLISNSDSQNSANDNTYAEGVVELQNGCACCSLADELFTSVVRLTQGGKRELDAIVVELSGVADPTAVRDNWKQAELQGHPATRLASLQRTVTLIDACTFGTDWMTWDTAGDRPSWAEEEPHAAVRKVPELLAEQVEAADLLVVNKIDLAGEEQVGIASGVARGLNDKAGVMEVEFGRVGARELLGRMLEDEVEDEVEEEGAHSHDHEHGHDHSSDHEHEASACADPDCADTSHSHSHEHSSACADPDCTDASHSHEHTSECDDPDCTDTSHSHSHDHKSSATATDHLGIISFVYKASVPFNSQRLLALLNQWPVPIKDSLELGVEQDGEEPDDDAPPEKNAFRGVLRSKGFCWMAPMKWSNSAGGDAWRHDTAMYWSHAGKHFGITTAGKWWGSLGKERMRPYFAGNEEEYDRIMREDWASEEWGDRRQELVFIGANLDEGDVRRALDDCLCTEEEMGVYRAQLRNYVEKTLSAARDGPSLFDVGATDHLDQ